MQERRVHTRANNQVGRDTSYSKHGNTVAGTSANNSIGDTNYSATIRARG